MIEQLIGVVHGALGTAIGKLPAGARRAEPDHDIFAVVELEALDAQLDIAAHAVLPQRQRRRVGEVERLAPAIEEHPRSLRKQTPLLGQRQVGTPRLQVRRVPQRKAQTGGVDLGDHRRWIGEARRVEVEAVDVGRVRSVDPDRTRRQVQVTNLADVIEHLRLVLVFVAPDPRPQCPRSRLLWRPGNRVIASRQVNRLGSSEQVEVQAACAVLPGAKGRLDEVRLLVGNREHPGATALDKQAPAARAQQQWHRHPHFVALRLQQIDLLLHRADLAALVDLIGPAPEPIKRFLRIDPRPQPHKRHLSLGADLGQEHGGKATGTAWRNSQAGVLSVRQLQRQL